MLLKPTDNLLLYGMQAAGKTTQLAELIKALYSETSKPALVYVTDWGGCDPIRRLVEKGQAELEGYTYGTDPFVWIDNAVQGKRWVTGKWIAVDATKHSLIAMESLTGQGDLVLNAIGHQVAEGKNVGGDAMKAPLLVVQAQGYQIKIAANTPTHYGMAQKHLLEKVWQSQLLPCPVVWTAHEDIAAPEKRDDSGAIRAEVAVTPGVRGMIGPLVAGHALTMHLGKYFVFMFRIKQEVTAAGVQHVLLTTRHKDGLYEGLAAHRAPLGAKVPARQEPADLVGMLRTIQAARSL